MADAEETDPHKNNMGVKIGPETDYTTWDWRKVQAAITGAVNTDLDTAANRLPQTSKPQSLYDSGDRYERGNTALHTVYDGLKYQTDTLVGVDKPLWTGPAADAFKGLMAKTLAAVKTHADPLKGPPSYKESMYNAGGALSTAIKTVYDQNYNAAQQVIAEYHKGDTQYSFAGSDTVYTYNTNPVPWYDYNGTTIVKISLYPKIDEQLSRDMRTTLQTLVGAYRGAGTDMAEPTGVLPTMPGAQKDPPPLKVDIPTPKMPKPPKQQPPPKPPDLKNPADGPGAGDPNLDAPGADGAPVGPDGQPLGPDGEPLGPDGQPLGPDGQPLGPDGQPLGPDGAPTGPDGQLLTDPDAPGDGGPPIGPDGQPLGPDGKPLTGPGADTPDLAAPGDNGLTAPQQVLTPNGPALVGPDGKTLVDPKTGKPLIGPDGKPLTVGNLPKNPTLVPPPGLTGPGGSIKGPGFKPVTGFKPTPPPKLGTPEELRNLPAFGRKPPLANLVAGGPPGKPGALTSEGALKPGAKEFGAPGEAAAGGRAAGGEGGRGEPMPMGGGGGAGGGGGERDRDRTTWLVEDEEVWGAETTLGAGVLGR